jgi:ubiquinone/menaquinone biosynthesis C-methylase UbiE
MKRMSLDSVGLPRVFDDVRFAGKYAARMAKRGRGNARQYARLLTENGFHAGRVLDAGCGAGDVAIELARMLSGIDMIGVDLSEPLLDRAESSARKAGLSDRMTWQKANVESLPFADDSFDAVVSVYMLHHVGEPVAMLNEIERVLSPRGVLILEDIARSWIGWFDRAFRTAFTWPEAKAILETSKLRPWKKEGRFLVFRVWAAGDRMPSAD